MEKYTEVEKQYLIKLGNAIRTTRKSKGLTQQNIAALCDSEKANLSRIESGKTNSTIITLKKIADVMQVPIADLLGIGFPL